jgi:hypothetical protein
MRGGTGTIWRGAARCAPPSMMSPPLPTRCLPPAAARRRTALAAVLWLAAFLVGTQLAGVAHRIEHPLGRTAQVLDAAQAPLHDQGAASIVLAKAAHDGHAHDGHAHDDHAHGAATHDCAAYDAAALGDGPPQLQAMATPPAAGRTCLPLAAAPRPAGGLRLAFRSRAPPRA